MDKLYKVTLKMMVLAEDKNRAKYVINFVDVDACNICVEEATECLPGWEEALPFGDRDDDTTCGELIKNL